MSMFKKNYKSNLHLRSTLKVALINWCSMSYIDISLRCTVLEYFVTKLHSLGI